MHSVYLITLENGKEYVGYTSRCPQQRLKEHLECSARTKFYSALSKYKLKSFNVLYECESELKALLREIYEIKNRNLQELGLNTDPGGYGRTLHIIPSYNNDGKFGYTVKKIRNRLNSQRRFNMIKKKRFTTRRTRRK